MYALLYVSVSCFVVHGCAVSRRYIDAHCRVLSDVNVYLANLKFRVVCVNGCSSFSPCSFQSGSLVLRYMSSRAASDGLLHEYDGVIVVWWDGQTKRCLTSCGVMPQSVQTLWLSFLLILLL